MASSKGANTMGNFVMESKHKGKLRHKEQAQWETSSYREPTQWETSSYKEQTEWETSSYKEQAQRENSLLLHI